MYKFNQNSQISFSDFQKQNRYACKAANDSAGSLIIQKQYGYSDEELVKQPID